MKRFGSWFMFFLFAVVFVGFAIAARAQETGAPDDAADILNWFKAIGAGYKAAGAFAAVAAGFYGFIKIIRTKFIQGLLGKLSQKLLWDNWPKVLTVFLVLGLPILAALFGGFAAHLSWSVILGGMFAALIAALTGGGIDGAVNAIAPKKEIAANPTP